MFTPPRPAAGGSSPAPRATLPPLTPSTPPLSLRPPPPSERPRSEAPEAELELRLARALRELTEARAALARSEGLRLRGERVLSEQSLSHGAALAALRGELEAARAAHKAALEQHSAELLRHSVAQRELEARVDELEAQALEVVSLRVQNGELEAALARSAALPRPAEAADDLKRLRGVGPAFERGLRALGITTFAQIASLSEGDIERVARSLKLKPERIVREDWVGAARSLLASPEKG